MDAPVSVIIPCYNCKDTIERAVESVWMQTWRPAELILVDDGSDKETKAKLYELKEKYSSWLKLIELEKNSGGPALPRNVGWENATQKYIALLDDDDAWHPRKIEIQLKFMIEHPEFVLTGHKVRIIQDGKINFELPEKLTYREISKTELALRNIIPSISVIMKSDIPFKFDYNFIGVDDYLMWLSIAFSGYRIALIEMPLAVRFKNYFDIGVLSGQLLNMEKNELRVYIKLMHEKKINRLLTYFLILFSLLKYFRRVLISLWRRYLGT